VEINSPTQDDKLVEGSPPPGKPPAEGMVWIPGGAFLMGSDRHYPEEAPAHKVTVNGFWMDRYAVTNADFRRFVEATRYVTLAERPANASDYPGAKPELLAPSSVMFKKAPHRVDLGNHYNWWVYVPGANWRHPQGPQFNIEGRDDHPVVQVSYEDALAYAKWAGKQLPTEAQFHRAESEGGDLESGAAQRAIAAHDDQIYFAALHQMSRGVVRDDLMGNPLLGQFPGCEGRPLRARPRFTTVHMKLLSLLLRRVHRSGSRADIDKGQPSGVTMSQ
jgi:hypothetical protein